MARHPIESQPGVYGGFPYTFIFEKANPPQPSRITVYSGSPEHDKKVCTVVAERFEDDLALNNRAHDRAKAHGLARQRAEGYADAPPENEPGAAKGE